jgi:hypothetical protein
MSRSSRELERLARECGGYVVSTDASDDTGTTAERVSVRIDYNWKNFVRTLDDPISPRAEARLYLLDEIKRRAEHVETPVRSSDEFSMDMMCSTCGTNYGAHSGVTCPDHMGEFQATSVYDRVISPEEMRQVFATPTARSVAAQTQAYRYAEFGGDRIDIVSNPSPPSPYQQAVDLGAGVFMDLGAALDVLAGGPPRRVALPTEPEIAARAARASRRPA